MFHRRFACYFFMEMSLFTIYDVLPMARTVLFVLFLKISFCKQRKEQHSLLLNAFVADSHFMFVAFFTLNLKLCFVPYLSYLPYHNLHHKEIGKILLLDLCLYGFLSFFFQNFTRNLSINTFSSKSTLIPVMASMNSNFTVRILLLLQKCFCFKMSQHDLKNE